MKKHYYHTHYCRLAIYPPENPEVFWPKPLYLSDPIKGYGAAIQEFRKLRAKLESEGEAPTEIREGWKSRPSGRIPTARFEVGGKMAEILVYYTELKTVTK